MWELIWQALPLMFETMLAPLGVGVVLALLIAIIEGKPLNAASWDRIAFDLLIIGAGSTAGIFGNQDVARGLERVGAGPISSWAIGLVLGDIILMMFIGYLVRVWKPSHWFWVFIKGSVQIGIGLLGCILSAVVIGVGYYNNPK